MTQHAWLVGGGIASLSAAALIVRSGRIDPKHVHVLEGGERFGGSLDGGGSVETGWTIRGGRMFEPHFGCTFGLFDRVDAEGIPSVESFTGEGAISVSELIHRFNEVLVPGSRCRLMRGGKGIEAPSPGLGLAERLALGRLFFASEARLGTTTIEAYLGPRFLASDFWVMWASMFAFQPWHSAVEMRRYMHRFCHLMPGFNRLSGVLRTPLNQYDTLIRPLLRDLRAAGVDLRTGARVTDVEFDAGTTTATALVVEAGGSAQRIEVAAEDRVFVTLGSMTEDSCFGSHDAPARLDDRGEGPAWSLWRRIAERSPRFGRPDAFTSDVRWLVWIPALACGLSFPLSVGFVLAPGLPGATALLAATTFTGAMIIPPIFAAVQSVVWPNARAMASAWVSLLLTAFGLGIGPPLVGWAADGLTSTYGDLALRYALLAAMPCFGWAAGHLLWASRSLREEIGTP